MNLKIILTKSKESISEIKSYSVNYSVIISQKSARLNIQNLQKRKCLNYTSKSYFKIWCKRE